MTNYKFGDIVLIDFLQSAGDKKRRPALVICLDKNDISHRLGQLTDYDKKEIISLWRRLYIFSLKP